MSNTGDCHLPSLGTGGFLHECQLFTNPPFKMTSNITETLQERGKRYGKFTDHARVTVGLKRVLSLEMERRNIVPADDQIEALHMICHKLGRIAAGDPDYADSWHDIAGYAQLVADRLNGVER
jgi:hypothetical protein